MKTRFDNVDLVIVRENTEGLYSGIENEVVPGVVTALKVATEAACTRIRPLRVPLCDQARGRKKVTVFHKANIMKLTDGLFLNVAQGGRRGVPEHRVRRGDHRRRLHEARAGPPQFDVLLMENLYGDLVSDLCAGLVGGLGVVPGSNIGDDAAVFEAVHGTCAGYRRQGRRQSARVHHVRRDDAQSPRRAETRREDQVRV